MGARARIVRTAVEGPPSGAEVDAADFVMVGDVVLKNRFGPTGRVVGGSNGVLPVGEVTADAASGDFGVDVPAPGDWMKSPEWLANAGHFLAGYGWMATTFLFVTLFANAKWGWCTLIVSQIVAGAIVLWKEFYIDLRDESGETLISSEIDALGYALGFALAWIIIAAVTGLGAWPR